MGSALLDLLTTDGQVAFVLAFVILTMVGMLMLALKDKISRRTKKRPRAT